jgi:hypothetical protein
VKQQQVGPFSGRYHPDYDLDFWHDGDPRQKVKGVNLRSVTAIQTAKSLDDISGTFTITLKDARARRRIREMDVARIRLKGHDGHGLTPVLKGVVDNVRQGGSADVYASREDTVIEGRCLAKYLQVTSLFLPVWDPQGVLPTALIFGLGDASKKVKGNTPFDIFDYLIKHYTWGKRNLAGVSGVPNSRFWLDHTTRFNKVDFLVPFLQFDEDAMSDALKRLEVTGYTESWVDELGHVVYRHPQWDQPARYRIPTGSLKDWDFPRSDVGATTYVEVIPAGDPGIDSAAAQALRAGRAPVPSSYLSGPDTAQLHVDPDFVIATDANGKVTAKGKKNFWYRRQRHLGLRPQQITSPLLFTQEQAQAQAEGLLQFYGRMIKTAQLTIPGYPTLRLGENFRVFGELDGGHIDRTFYIDQVSHEYVEGEGYSTSFRGSHGRDPWDPKWGTIAIPKFDPAKLSQQGGILSPGGGGGGGGVVLGAASPARPGRPQPARRHQQVRAARRAGPRHQRHARERRRRKCAPRPDGQRHPLRPPGTAELRVGGRHVERLRHAAGGGAGGGALAHLRHGLQKLGRRSFSRTAFGFRFQLIHRSMIGGNHYDHVHFGV